VAGALRQHLRSPRKNDILRRHVPLAHLPELSRRDPPPRRKWLHYHESADSIIATSGARLLETVRWRDVLAAKPTNSPNLEEDDALRQAHVGSPSLLPPTSYFSHLCLTTLWARGLSGRIMTIDSLKGFRALRETRAAVLSLVDASGGLVVLRNKPGCTSIDFVEDYGFRRD
jgi:hypothetical protein